MKDPKKTINLMHDPERFRQWGAMGPKLRKKNRTMTSQQARRTVMVRWDRVRALALDAAGAAAPELLEALDNLAREVTTLDMFGETGNTASKANVDGALDQARAAIAKATT